MQVPRPFFRTNKLLRCVRAYALLSAAAKDSSIDSTPVKQPALIAPEVLYCAEKAAGTLHVLLYCMR